MSTTRTQLVDLTPGARIQDLIANGTVEKVTALRAGAVRVDLASGLSFAGPGTFTVTTIDEEDER
jgi:hypothetical protein